MCVSDSTLTRLKACLLLSSAVGCVVFAGVLLRRGLQHPKSPPAVQCPFAENTVALLRDLHDGPFRFGDPTPVAAAARKEAMRRIHRQQAHRRHLRNKMRLLFFRSQQRQQQQHQQVEGHHTAPESHRTMLWPASTTTTAAVHTESGDQLGDSNNKLPLPLDAIASAEINSSGRSGEGDGSNYEGRFAERHRRLQKLEQQRLSRLSLGASPTAATDNAKTFVQHARAMLSTPVNGVLGATKSLTSSFTESETWDSSYTARRRRRQRLRCSSCGSSNSSASSCYSSDAYSSRSSTLTSTVDSYTATSTTVTSTASSLFTSSSPAGSVCTTGSATALGGGAMHDGMTWNSGDFNGLCEGAVRGSQRSFSSLSHPPAGDTTGVAASSPSRRFTASYSHSPSTVTCASPHPQRSSSNDQSSMNYNNKNNANNNNKNTYYHNYSSSALAAPASYHTYFHSHPQLQYTFDSTSTSLHRHYHSSSQAGTYLKTGSYPEAAFAAAITTTTNAALSSAGGDVEELYGYPVSAALYGPPLFATEMDVTDALAELRNSVYYSADRQGGSCLGINHNNNNYNSSGNNVGSMGGGNMGSGSGLGVVNLLGGALTMSTVGQASVPVTSMSSQGHGASFSCCPNYTPSYFTISLTNTSVGGGTLMPHNNHYYSSQGHHHHSRGHRSLGQGGGGSNSNHPTTHHHDWHLHSHQHQPHHNRTGSTGGVNATYQRVPSRTSLRHSHTDSPLNSQLLPVHSTLPGTSCRFSGASLLPQSTTGNGVSAMNNVGGGGGSSYTAGTPAPLSRMSSFVHNNSLADYSHSAGVTAAASGMVNSFQSAGGTGMLHRRPAYGARRWWRRTRRHMRRRLHDWRTAIAERVLIVTRAAQRSCNSLERACVNSVRTTFQLVALRSTTLARSAVVNVRRRARHVCFFWRKSTPAREADASFVPLLGRCASDALGAPSASPTGTKAAGSTNNADTTTEAKTPAPETTDQQQTIDANSMEEAINKVVEMLAPSPGRVPTVVVIRAPLGYDVSNDAESLWAALNLDSTSFEEGLVDVVMMEELKTEPLPPVPPAPSDPYTTSTNANSGSCPSSTQPESVCGTHDGNSGGACRRQDSSRGFAVDVTGENARGPAHPLGLDSATNVAAATATDVENQRQPTSRPGNINISSTTTPSSTERSALRASTPQPTMPGKKADLRITFELYPAHIFYSSIIRVAILQEKDLALRRAAAELYGGSADLDGSCNSGSSNGMGLTSTTAGCVGVGNYGSHASPFTSARAASSVLGYGQRGGNNSYGGNVGADVGGGSGNSNVLSTVENFRLTPIAPGHFIRAPRSPKPSGMFHSHSTSIQGFSHHDQCSNSNAGITMGANGGAHHAQNSNGLPLLPLPPPSVPPAPSLANAGGTAAGPALISSPTSLSPIITPSLPASASSVVVRLSASYSFPALPPQMVRSPLQNSQGVMPHSPCSIPISIGTSVLNAPCGGSIGGGLGIGMCTPSSAQGNVKLHSADRFSAARRLVNRSEVLLYIHALRTVVADAATATTALPSCILSDSGEEDGVSVHNGRMSAAGNSVSDTTVSLTSTVQRNNAAGGSVGCGRGTVSPNTSIRTAKPPSTPFDSPNNQRKMNSYSDQRDISGDILDDGQGDVVEDHDAKVTAYEINEHDEMLDERAEEAQTLLELRQCEIEAPVLLRYRLRICHQGARSLEALKRTEKYTQDHVSVWQDEAKKMLQAMPPTEAAVVVSAVASGQQLSSVSTPSLLITSSPVLRPADAANVRLLSPPVGGHANNSNSNTSSIGGGGGNNSSAWRRSIHRSSSRYRGLPTLAVCTAPLTSNHDGHRDNDRDNGPLHLPAWAMEVLIRRESMRETLIRDLKEKAFRICSIPLPDMRVHCILPPVVPRYTVAHARGFPLSRTFAEEVLSQQRTLQFILLQREKENQRVIAAELRRAVRRQERHERHRRERRARAEERRRQQAEKKKGKSLKTRLTNSMNPATIVSRVASMVKKSAGKDVHTLPGTDKLDTDGVAPAFVSVAMQKMPEATSSPLVSPHDLIQPEVRSGTEARQQCHHSQQIAGDFYSTASTVSREAHQNTMGGEPEGRGVLAALWGDEWMATNTTTATTTAMTTESDVNAVDNSVAMTAQNGELGQLCQRSSPSSQLILSLPSPSLQQQHKLSRQEGSFQQSQNVLRQTLTSLTEHEVLLFGGSHQNNTSFGTLQNPALTTVQATSFHHDSTATTTGADADSNATGFSSCNNSGSLSDSGAEVTGAVLPSPPVATSGERGVCRLQWNATTTPSTPLTSALAPQVASLAIVTNSTKTSPGVLPLSQHWHAQHSLQPQPQPISDSSSTNKHLCRHAHNDCNCGGRSTRPLYGQSDRCGSNWTAVHTATNVNSGMTLPPSLEVPTGGVGKDGDRGLSGQLQHNETRSANINALEADTDDAGEDEAFPFTLNGVNKDGYFMGITHSSHCDGSFGGGSNVCGSSGQRSPLPPPSPSVLQQLHTCVSGFHDGCGHAAPASGDSLPTTANTVHVMDNDLLNAAAAAETFDMEPSTNTVIWDGSLELGVTPPFRYFTRPQSAAGIPSTPPLKTLTEEQPYTSTLTSAATGGTETGTAVRASLLVPATGYAAAAVTSGDTASSNGGAATDGGLLLSSQTSSARSPPPAVPNNSMYGTFDAYYGHSAAKPQAVLLRQQAQAAAVAGLTGASITPSTSLPSHLRRTPASGCPVPPVVATTVTVSDPDVDPATGCSKSVPGVNGNAGSSRGTNVVSVTSAGNISRLLQSPSPPKSIPRAHKQQNSLPSPSSAMQYFHAPRANNNNNSNYMSGVGGGNNTSSGPRRTGSGLLPYTYSADSVSSMYGTAHYPLYQYPDDTVAQQACCVAGSCSAGTSGSNLVCANTSQQFASHHNYQHNNKNSTAHNPSTGMLGRLASGAGVAVGCRCASSAPNSVLNCGRAVTGGTPRLLDSPSDNTIAMGAARADSGLSMVAPSVIQDTHMNRLKQYNKLLSDLLGVAGGPMRSGISFYYTYGDATALLYNASIQVPSDEDILELLEQQRSAQQLGQGVKWDGSLDNGCADATSSSDVTMPITTAGGNDINSNKSSGGSGGGSPPTKSAEAGPTQGNKIVASSGSGSGAAFSDSVISSVSPTPPAARIPATLVMIGDSPPALPRPRQYCASAPGARGTVSASNAGSSATKKAAVFCSDGGSGVEGIVHEDEGCSYLDYGDTAYPEDSMDALEAEQIDAQRTRNKNFHSIFEHLHRAFYDAVFEPRNPTNSTRSRSLSSYNTGPLGTFTTAGAGGGGPAAAAADWKPPPPLGGFTTTASFIGAPKLPHHTGRTRSFSQRVLWVPYRVYVYACSLLRWVGWKVGLVAAQPVQRPRSSISGCDDFPGDADVYCGVFKRTPETDRFASPSSSPCPAGSMKQQREDDEAARLARRFPGERIVTFGREWRVASRLDMHNGHFGLSPLHVWMATRYSRRFAGEVYLMDVVAAGSDPYYPAVRVLDEVVAHAVLYYHNHSLRDFTEDLASELGLEYVPQTVWGRRALGLPINETEVQELDGLLYTATRRQQEMRQRQQQQRERARQRKAHHHANVKDCSSFSGGGVDHEHAKSPQRQSTSTTATSTSEKSSPGMATTNTASIRVVEASGGETFVATEHGNDADRRTSTPKALHTRITLHTMDSTRLSQGIDADDEFNDSGGGAATELLKQSHNEGKDGKELMQQQQQQADKNGQKPRAAKALSTLVEAAADCTPFTPIMCESIPSSAQQPGYSPVVGKAARCSSSSSSSGSFSRSRNGDACDNTGSYRTHADAHCFAGTTDPFAGVDENLWVAMQSYDQEEDEEVFYGATAAAVVGIGSGEINVAPHIYDAVMEREVYDERMLLRELDHLKDFLIENRNVLSSAMLTTTGSNALEAVFGVPATVFPFLLCARESVPLVSSIFESLSYYYGALTYDNFSKMTYDAYHMDRPDVLRHTPRLFRMLNKSRRGCITYEELCGWLARKLSCGNNIQPNAHLLAAMTSLRLPLALVAESREDWDRQRCSLKALSDAEDEEY